MDQLDLFDNLYSKEECIICGAPLSVDRVMNSIDICEDCESTMLDEMYKEEMDNS